MAKRSIDISKNIGITSCNEVIDICRPLYDILDLTYFNYVKLNPDGSRSTITDRPDFIVEYYSRKELFETKAVVNMEHVKNSTCRLSCEFRDQYSYQVARNDFNIDNGITIIQPNGKETELYYFGTTRGNFSKTHLYTSNIDMFYRFIAYFKDKAQKIIKQADKEKFILPISANQNNSPDIEEENISNIRKRFFEATNIDRYFIENKKAEIFLTKREAESLYYLMHLKSAKDIAKLLNISPRTVENHLAHVKEKLECRTKKDVLNKLTTTDLGRIMSYYFMGPLQQSGGKLLYPINLITATRNLIANTKKK